MPVIAAIEKEAEGSTALAGITIFVTRIMAEGDVRATLLHLIDFVDRRPDLQIEYKQNQSTSKGRVSVTSGLNEATSQVVYGQLTEEMYCPLLNSILRSAAGHGETEVPLAVCGPLGVCSAMRKHAAHVAIPSLVPGKECKFKVSVEHR